MNFLDFLHYLMKMLVFSKNLATNYKGKALISLDLDSSSPTSTKYLKCLATHSLVNSMILALISKSLFSISLLK